MQNRCGCRLQRTRFRRRTERLELCKAPTEGEPCQHVAWSTTMSSIDVINCSNLHRFIGLLAPTATCSAPQEGRRHQLALLHQGCDGRPRRKAAPKCGLAHEWWTRIEAAALPDPEFNSPKQLTPFLCVGPSVCLYARPGRRRTKPGRRKGPESAENVHSDLSFTEES